VRDDVTENEAVDAMQQFGGGFIQALALAWYRADSRNREVLRGAFAHYFKEFAELAALQKAKRP